MRCSAGLRALRPFEQALATRARLLERGAFRFGFFEHRPFAGEVRFAQFVAVFLDAGDVFLHLLLEGGRVHVRRAAFAARAAFEFGRFDPAFFEGLLHFFVAFAAEAAGRGAAFRFFAAFSTRRGFAPFGHFAGFGSRRRSAFATFAAFEFGQFDALFLQARFRFFGDVEHPARFAFGAFGGRAFRPGAFRAFGTRARGRRFGAASAARTTAAGQHQSAEDERQGHPQHRAFHLLVPFLGAHSSNSDSTEVSVSAPLLSP